MTKSFYIQIDTNDENANSAPDLFRISPEELGSFFDRSDEICAEFGEKGINTADMLCRLEEEGRLTGNMLFLLAGQGLEDIRQKRTRPNLSEILRMIAEGIEHE